MRLLLPALAIVLTPGFAAPAVGYVADCGGGDMRAAGAGPELADLWSWVQRRLGADEVLPPPAVCRISEGDMADLVFAGEVRGGQMSLVAIYDTPQRRILLTADWAPGSPRDQSMIVHELVHHAQALLGRRHDCPQAREEEEAYRLQKEWLQGSGGDLKSEFGIDGLTLLVLTTCGF